MPDPTSTDVVFSRSICASAKAIAKDAELSIDPDDSAAAQLGLKAPHKATDNLQNERTLTRAVSDSIAVVAAHHDEDLHNRYKPASRLARSLFNEMERLRCECLGANNRIGVTNNLQTLWQKTLQPPFKDDNDQLTLVFSYLTRAALKQPVKPTDAMLQVLSKWQETIWNSTSHLWPKLLDSGTNQSDYANVSLDIIATINEDTSHQASDTASTAPAEDQEQKASDESPEDSQESEDSDTLASMEMRDDDYDKEDVLLADSTDSQFDEDTTQNRDAPVDADSESNAGSFEQATAPYKSYSNTYDEVVKADTLCSASERTELRQLLDSHIDRHSRVVGRLAGKLQRVLMAQQNRHWKFDLEEGVLDTSRLTRIVTQPYSGLSFKQESDIEFKNTTVTLLVDNSKSMLGKPIAIAAACADILAQTLERCGVSVEILGFTTTELHGGALFDLWKKQGKSVDPGRLNGLRHIVYKSANVPYRRARDGFGVMLHKELLKQNIDGEALLWANERLQRRPEERKILLVISDGAPIDTSTMSANKDNYLIDHLHEVIGKIEKSKNLQLAAIGIGHDVSNYYKHAVTIRDARDLGKTLLTQLRSVIAPPARFRRKQGTVKQGSVN